MTEDEIIIRTWASICENLQAASFADGADDITKKSLRAAARQIRSCLLKGGKQFPKGKDIEVQKNASALAYNEANRQIEAMVADVDEMARLIAAGHSLKHRLKACRIRLVHAITVLGYNIQDLVEKEGAEQ
jgi:hypothetical protein